MFVINYGTYPSKYLREGMRLKTSVRYASMEVTSLLKRSKFFNLLNSFSGPNVSRLLILLPDRFRYCSLGLVARKFNPLEIRLSDNSNLFKWANLGKHFNDVKPTLMRLNDSRFTYSSKPTILVLLQLSRFRSFTWK